MYFLEFLENCTIRWVLICEGGVGLFYFFGGRATDRAGLGGGYMPRRCTPAPSSAPGRTAQHRPSQMQGRPRKTRRTGTHARTLDRSTIDTRQAARGKSGRRRALDCMQSIYHAYYDSSITGMAKAQRRPFEIVLRKKSHRTDLCDGSWDSASGFA